MTKNKDNPAIPRMVVKRLTECLAHVKRLREAGVEWVSSQGLAEDLDLTSSTVRQDLSHLDFSGISKRGYETRGLEDALADVLGANMSWAMAVVGAGNLGRALALHEEFPRNGFHIAAIFDNDAHKVGRRIGPLVVQHVDDLSQVLSEKTIDIGVLAVPFFAAQKAADALVQARVRGILNLALAHISAPPHVSVVDSRIVAALQELAHELKMRGPGSP